MTDFSRAEAADRGGVDGEALDRMVEHGIVVPNEHDRFSESDIRKIGLIGSFATSGVPVDAIAGEIHEGHFDIQFLDSPSFVSFMAQADVTFEELAAQRGLPIEVLLAIREAIGSEAPKPTDRVRDIELRLVPSIEAQIASGYSPDAVERLVRILGDGVRRVALANSEAFRQYVIEPVSSGSGLEISAAAEAASDRMTDPTDEAIVAMYRAQLGNAWTANIVGALTYHLAEQGIVGAPAKHPAMCFLDITGYTRLTSERGDKAAADLADVLGRIVTRVSVEHGGRPVKWLGDGVMFHFKSPGPGVLAALTMAAEIPRAGLPPAHVGLHAGPVVFQDGDYYGSTVNLAARIADYARPGEVLVSKAVVEASTDSALDFTDLGLIELKGAPAQMELYAARRRAG